METSKTLTLAITTEEANVKLSTNSKNSTFSILHLNIRSINKNFDSF